MRRLLVTDSCVLFFLSLLLLLLNFPDQIAQTKRRVYGAWAGRQALVRVGVIMLVSAFWATGVGVSVKKEREDRKSFFGTWKLCRRFSACVLFWSGWLVERRGKVR